MRRPWTICTAACSRTAPAAHHGERGARRNAPAVTMPIAIEPRRACRRGFAARATGQGSSHDDPAADVLGNQLRRRVQILPLAKRASGPRVSASLRAARAPIA